MAFQVVSPHWLWSSAERWEKSQEKLFPLRDVPLDAGKWRAKGGAPESVVEQTEQREAAYLREEMLKLSQRNVLPEALVPSLAIGSDALAEMDKEVDDELSDDDEDDDDDDVDVDEDNDAPPRKKTKMQSGASAGQEDDVELE